MSKPIFKITIEGHGDLDGDGQPDVVFDADLLGMDIVRFKQTISIGSAFGLFQAVVTQARKVLGF